MSRTTEAITLIFPSDAISGILSLSASLTDRMHALLERNTDGNLSDIEKSELETLVQIAQFGQMVSTALQPAINP